MLNCQQRILSTEEFSSISYDQLSVIIPAWSEIETIIDSWLLQFTFVYSQSLCYVFDWESPIVYVKFVSGERAFVVEAFRSHQPANRKASLNIGYLISRDFSIIEGWEGKIKVGTLFCWKGIFLSCYCSFLPAFPLRSLSSYYILKKLLKCEVISSNCTHYPGTGAMEE